MIEPIHVATINGQPVRFFRTPNDDGKPDLPWHRVDDLHHCLGLDRVMRRYFLNMLRKRAGIQTVATTDGIVTVAPHYMAQGTLDAMVAQRMVLPSVRTAYDHEGAVALKKLVAPLAYGTDVWFGWVKAAMNRHDEEA